MNDRKMSDREEKIRTVSDRALAHCLSRVCLSTQHNKTKQVIKRKTRKKQATHWQCEQRRRQRQRERRKSESQPNTHRLNDISCVCCVFCCATSTFSSLRDFVSRFLSLSHLIISFRFEFDTSSHTLGLAHDCFNLTVSVCHITHKHT